MSYNVTAYVCDALAGFEKQFPAVVEQFTVSGGGSRYLSEMHPNYYGHTFMGWYTDSSYTHEWDIHNTVTSDMTLYGKWSIKPYVTYAEVGGKDADGNISVFEAVHNPNNVVYMSLPIDTQLNRNSLKLNISEKVTMQASAASSLENGTFYASSTSNSATSLKLKAKQSQITSQATFDIKSSDGGKSWGPANAADSYIDYNLMGLRTIAKNASLGDIQNFQLARGMAKGDESGEYIEKYNMTAELFGTTMTLIFVPESLSDTYKVHYNVLGKDKYTVNLYHDSFAINYTPNYYGYDFEGWYKDAAFTIPWDFENEIITGETTLYAKLEKNELLDGIEPFDYDTNDTWIIKSKGEFQMFASMVTAEGYNFTDKTVILDTDIDFNGATIMPVGDSITKFNGTFDGRNHTISNYTAEYMGSGTGLFGNADSKSLLCNVKLKNVTIKSTDSIIDGAGALVGHSYGRIINCHVDGLEAAKSRYMGGIVGNTYSNIIACSVDNATINAYQSHAGGIAGGGAPTITDCYIGKNVTVKASGGLNNYNYALIGGATMGDTINSFVNQSSTSFVGKAGLAGADSKAPTNCYSLSSKAGSTQADYEAKGWVFYDPETNPDGNWIWDSASGTPVLADKLYVIPAAN